MISEQYVIRKVSVALLLTFIFTTNLFSQGVNNKVAEANKLFAEQKYDEANTKYRDALVDHPKSDILQFNIGDVHYKKNSYEEALKSYQSALSSEDILMQAQSYYNMGNTLYKMGKLPESILHYRKALELNPDDEDAKYNMEYVRAKLKDDAQKDGKNSDEKQDPIKPTEYAKKLYEDAKSLVAKRNYIGAKRLLDEGLKRDKTVEVYRNFMTRLDDVIGIGE